MVRCSTVRDLWDAAKMTTGDTRRQLLAFGSLVAVNAAVAFLIFALGLNEQFGPLKETPPPFDDMPAWLLGLANAGIVVALYSLLGLAGFWFARRLGLPGIFREHAGWRNWVLVPLVWGAVLGAILIVSDRLFVAAHGQAGFPHPGFPLSLFASLAAGIGEEILYRLFVMSLWAFLLSLLLKRWGATKAALWVANVIAALAFGAGHIPGVMLLLDVASPAEIPMLILVEVFLLNGIVGIVAGARYVRDGLIAAVGVHFWTDIVWHVLWPLVGASS